MNRLTISLGPPEEPEVRRAVRVLSMVHELHKAGCHLLRIVPGVSASGGSWRTGITVADLVDPDHGAMPKPGFDYGNPEDLWALYSMADKNRFFDWRDAESDSARQLADKFIGRFPRLVEAGTGRDWAYVGWYAETLGRAEHGDLPMAYFEEYGEPRAEQ